MAVEPMLVGLLIGVLQAPPSADTVRLSADQAFERAVASAPALEAARRRAAAAAGEVEQARAWANPTLTVTAENLGATRPISGVGGVSGLEGQAVLMGWVPIGGDRGAARSVAAAREHESRALAAVAEADVRLTLVQSLARWRENEAGLRRAREEGQALGSFASGLAAQADRGRASEGDAARAHLAMVSALSAAAEAEARAAATRSSLAVILGLAASTQVVVSFPDCTVRSPSHESPQEPADAIAARARQAAAAARLDQRRALAIPDVSPQIGVRRAAGVSALYAGLSVGLPLFDRGSAGKRAAAEEVAAASADLDAVTRSLDMEEAAARRGVEALEMVGAEYGEAWLAALARTVTSAEARYRLGEGTLTELLDGRRARLAALADYERWRAELVAVRARLARATGAAIGPETLCVLPDRVEQSLDSFNQESRQ